MSSPDPGVLHKIRALLAKAESTTFPDEAEALSAKAQALMARHAVDRAMLAAAGAAREQPEGRTVTIASPYVRPKFQLLGEVAVANGCRAVFHRAAGDATLVGFPTDAELVELLYTSLLVQATTAALAAGATPAMRTRAFRHSFLVAYAARIGERLRASAQAAQQEAGVERGEEILPVMASRGLAVDDHLRELFPDLGRMRLTASDGAGLAAGHAAADRARLDGADIGAAQRLALGG